MKQFVKSVKKLVCRDGKYVSVAGNKLTLALCLRTYKAALNGTIHHQLLCDNEQLRLHNYDLDRDNHIVCRVGLDNLIFMWI